MSDAISYTGGMNFYSIQNLPASYERENVFKIWPIPKIAAVVIFSFLGGLLIYFGYAGSQQIQETNLRSTLCYWIGGWLILFAWVAYYSARNALRQTNWLMKTNSERLLIKYRSYQNHHFPKEDTVVLEIPTQNVEWIREVRETLTSPSMDEDRTSTSTFLDLKLSTKMDLTRIKEALRTERMRQAPRKGISRSRVLHYPVQYVEPDILRLEWNGIRPNIKQSLQILKMQFSVHTAEDYQAKDWNQLEGQEVEDRILDLAQRGRTLDATNLATLKLNLSSTEAVHFVDELMDQAPK